TACLARDWPRLPPDRPQRPLNRENHVRLPVLFAQEERLLDCLIEGRKRRSVTAIGGNERNSWFPAPVWANMSRSQKDGTYWPKRVRGTSYYVRYRRLLLLNAFSCPQ